MTRNLTARRPNKRDLTFLSSLKSPGALPFLESGRESNGREIGKSTIAKSLRRKERQSEG